MAAGSPEHLISHSTQVRSNEDKYHYVEQRKNLKYRERGRYIECMVGS